MKTTASRVLGASVLVAAGFGAQSADEWLVYGRVVDEALVPIAGARVRHRDRVSDPVSTGPDGSFAAWVGWGQAEQALVVEAEGFATRFWAYLPPEWGGGQLGDITLRPGGTVRGRILGPDGAPRAGAAVTLCPPDLSPSSEKARLIGPLELNLLRGTSGADGRFEIAGAGVGPVRVWAGADGMRFIVSPPVEVRARCSTEDVELALESLQHEDWFHGIVRAPDGAPVPGARLRCIESPIIKRGWQVIPVDSEGRFKLLRLSEAYDFVIWDDAKRWAGVEWKDVRPGDRELDLRFQALRGKDDAERAPGGDAQG